MDLPFTCLMQVTATFLISSFDSDFRLEPIFISDLEQLKHFTKQSLIFKHDMFFFLWNLSSSIIYIVPTISLGLGHV